MRRIIGAALGLAAGLSAGAVAAQDCDVASGEKLFARCKACHKVEEGGKGVGPHLFGIVGRPVASLPDYAYSDAMKEYGAGGVVWDHDRLAIYLENPREVVPGTKMAFAGLPKDEQRRDVICYLDTLH